MLTLFICMCIAAVTATDKRAGQDVPAVAFSAGVTRMLTMTHGERVVFDRLFTNIGGGYDTSTGLFRCPQSGIYVFQFHSLSHQDKTVWLQLYHNYNYVVSTYGHTSSDYGSAGNSVVLHLSKNDEVYVKAVDAKNGASSTVYGASDEVYSTFSGYLISPVYEEYPIVG